MASTCAMIHRSVVFRGDKSQLFAVRVKVLGTSAGNCSRVYETCLAENPETEVRPMHDLYFCCEMVFKWTFNEQSSISMLRAGQWAGKQLSSTFAQNWHLN